MGQNLTNNREAIYDQIREIHGKLVYSFTTHLKDSKIVSKRSNFLKLLNIILSAVSTGGIIAVLIDWNATLCGILTSILTTTILVISTYLKYANLDEVIISHRNTANNLWLIREKVVSLLTDFSFLTNEEIRSKRDIYILEISRIYSSELNTSEKAYRMAQSALKNKEEQYFSDRELDDILPKQLRKKK